LIIILIELYSRKVFEAGRRE